MANDLSKREAVGSGLTGRLTGPPLVRLRAAGNVPAVVSAWIASRGVDGNVAINAFGLRSFQLFRS